VACVKSNTMDSTKTKSFVKKERKPKTKTNKQKTKIKAK